MANKNQVTLTFAGDSDKLEKAFSKTTSDAKKFSAGIEAASRQSGAALSKASEDAKKFGHEVESSSNKGTSGLLTMAEKGSAGLAKLAKAGLVAAAALAAAGAAAAYKFGSSLLSSAHDASDLNEALSKSNTVFGKAAKDIETFATGAAKSIGLSKKEALDAAGSFGNLFSQLGIGADKSALMSKQIIGLAADFASFHNADITDVIEAQSAAFRGEYDSLQKYLPLISAATVKTEALALSHKKGEKQLTATDKALAVQSLMLKGAGAAAGDFARTATGMANAERIARAEMENMRAEAGQKMIPVAMALTKLKLKLATVLGAVLAPAIDRVTKYVAKHKKHWLDLGKSLKKKAIPILEDIGSVFLGIVKTIRTKVFPIVKKVGAFIIDKVGDASGWLIKHKDLWLKIASTVKNTVWPVIRSLGGLVGSVFGLIGALLKSGGKELGEHKQGWADIAKTITEDVVPKITDFIDGLKEKLDKAKKWVEDHKHLWDDLGKAIDKATKPLQTLGEAAANVFDVIAGDAGNANKELDKHGGFWANVGKAFSWAGRMADKYLIPALDKVAGFIKTFSEDKDAVNALLVTVGVIAAVLGAPAVAAGAANIAAVAVGLAEVAAAALPFAVAGALIFGIVYNLMKNWDLLKWTTIQIWGDIFYGIKGIVGNLVRLFTKIPLDIKTAFSTLADIIIFPFKVGFAGVKLAWNSTIGGKGFTTPDWLPFGMGGKSFKIPYLADGGIVNSPTIAMIGEKGPEAVVPLSHSSGPMGGPVVIEIHSGGSDLDRVILEILRRAIRTRGGVEVALR